MENLLWGPLNPGKQFYHLNTQKYKHKINIEMLTATNSVPADKPDRMVELREETGAQRSLTSGETGEE